MNVVTLFGDYSYRVEIINTYEEDEESCNKYLIKVNLVDCTINFDIHIHKIEICDFVSDLKKIRTENKKKAHLSDIDSSFYINIVSIENQLSCSIYYNSVNPINPAAHKTFTDECTSIIYDQLLVSGSLIKIGNIPLTNMNIE